MAQIAPLYPSMQIADPATGAITIEFLRWLEEQRTETNITTSSNTLFASTRYGGQGRKTGMAGVGYTQGAAAGRAATAYSAGSSVRAATRYT